MTNLIPTSLAEIQGIFVKGESNLEDEIMIDDFFRFEEGYDPKKPLVGTKTGGLMAFYTMEGVDPEPLSREQVSQACAAVKRSMDQFATENIENRWKGGQWEIMNIFQRKRGNITKIRKPVNESQSYFIESYNQYWQERNTLTDSLYWVVGFNPKMKNNLSQWKAMLPNSYAELFNDKQRSMASMLRHRAQGWEEDLRSFTILRPPTQFGLRPLSEEEIFRFLYGLINRAEDEEIPSYNPRKSLLRQIAYSRRDNQGFYYKINDKYCCTLSFKDYPENSTDPDDPSNYGFKGLQDKCNFPHDVVNVWTSVDPKEMNRFINRNLAFSTKLAETNQSVKAWKDEADEYQRAVTVDNSAPFLWKTTFITLGDTPDEMRTRKNTLSSTLSQLKGAKPLEETKKTRKLVEMGTIPGNQFMNLRQAHCTSVNAGDMASVFRLSTGAEKPYYLFGDRRGGFWGFDILAPELPSHNKLTLGTQGTGKSALAAHDVIALSFQASQIYVMEEGNTFGPIFITFAEDNPGDVAIMRFADGDFWLNPFPLVKALQEREKQIQDGTYRMDLGEGIIVPCPVEYAKEMFAIWLEMLLSEEKPLTADQRNLLDMALRGKDGGMGFFNQYEYACKAHIEDLREGLNPAPPQPLSLLLPFINSEAPEFRGALEYWTREPQKKYFDSGLDTISTAKKIHFELSGIKNAPHVAKPFVAALMMSVWARFTDPRFINEVKTFTIDEAWAYLDDPAFAEPIERMERTSRKFNGYVHLLTQKPEDIENPALKGIVGTCTQAFLYPGFATDDFLRKSLGFNDHQVGLYQNLQCDDRQREVLYWNRTGVTKVLRFEIEPHWYWLITTNATDKELRAGLRKAYPDRKKLIDFLYEACEGKTIFNKNYRQEKVLAYARSKGIAV